MLRTSPGYALAVILTLALGIGATTAMFTVIDGVLLKRFAVKDQHRLLVVWTSIPERGFEHWALSYASYLGIRERLGTVSGVAAHPYAGTLDALLHHNDGSAEPLRRTAVTGDWFEVLGVRARAGRLLTPADDRVGAPHVVVLSSSLAERLFGRVTDAIGRRVRIDEATFTVVGVTPVEFDYPRTADAWVPAVWFRHSPYVAWDLVVRVAPGFTKHQTVADLTAALASLPPETGPLGGIHHNQVIHAQTFAESVVGHVRPVLLMLAASALLMLIVAGVNVANLLIVRALARRRELVTRAAIGASRVRLLRQLVTEAVVLASIAAALAVFVASLGLHALHILAPAELPRLAEIEVDQRALAFTAAMGMLAAVVFGTVPALHASRVDPAEALRTSEASGGPYTRRQWLRQALVVGQIAMTMIVMSAAGLLVKSFERMQRLDVGFDAKGIFLASVAIPPSRYREPAEIQRAMTRLADLAATLPGVSHTTAVATPPFAGTQGVDATVFAEGQAMGEAANPIVNYEGVDSSYFATFDLPIVRGRGVDARDRAGSQPAVVVNEMFARVFWPGKDPIGRRITWGSSASMDSWLTVVGVAADTRYRELTTARPTIYVPYPHGIPVTPTYLAVRGIDPVAISGAVRRAVSELEPGAVVVSIEPLPHLLATPLARPRFQMTLIVCFAALALALSVVGVYGMLSFVVRQRRHEIGIRMALGAAPSNVCALVLRYGLTIGVLGTSLGLTMALLTGGIVQRLLFEVTATDPLVLLGTSMLLFGAIFAATLVPTRLATRTDPLRVLRGE